MKCPNCGKELPESTKFCIYCGTKLIVEQPKEVAEESVVQKDEPKIEPKVEKVEKNTTVKVEKYSEAEKKTFKQRRWGCGLIVLIFLAIGFFSQKDDSKTPSSEPSYVGSEVTNEDTNTETNTTISSQSDESSSEEGEEMSAEKLERLIIETEESYDDNSSFESSIFGFLSEREVTKDDLAGKSSEELRRMRNALYAKYGYIFKSQDLNEYFMQFPWYSEISTDVSSQLSSIEKRNVQIIKSYE